MLVGGYAAIWLFSSDQWWRWFGVIAVLAFLLGMFGLVEGLQKTHRDAIGRAVEPGSPES